MISSNSPKKRGGRKRNGKRARDYLLMRPTSSLRFKLRLRPRAVDPEQKLSRLPSLPPTKTIIDVFADFLRYLFDCTKTYIQESHPSGAAFWAPFEDTFELVLTHPNGWEGRQQSLMRLAAVQGGLVPDDDAGRSRVTFVTEGEASLNFCLSKGLLDGDLGVRHT